MVPEGQLILAGLASAPGSEVPQDVRRGSDRSAGADGLIPICGPCHVEEHAIHKEKKAIVNRDPAETDYQWSAN